MARTRRFTLTGKKRYALLTIVILPVALVFNIIVVIVLLLNPRSWKFNKAEAIALLEKEMDRFRTMSYEECKKHVEEGPVVNTTIAGSSGEEYQLEIQMIWERCAGGPIRVLGGIDDGRLRAYVPVSRSFIVNDRSVSGKSTQAG